VLRLEGALAAANQEVLAYCAPRHLAVSLCFEGGINVQDPAILALAQAFAAQSLVFRQVSDDVAALPLPDMGAPLLNRQIDRLVEDLALYGVQLADLLQEYDSTIGLAAQALTPNASAALQGLAYGPRVRGLAAILRRAEGWLETIDHETGARARLPGFEPGAPSPESQLASHAASGAALS
jgi:hypothetical protein